MSYAQKIQHRREFVVPGDYGAQYFGTTHLGAIPKPVMQHLLDAPQVADVTAGSGRQLVNLSYKKIPVVAGDLSVYSASLCAAALTNAAHIEIPREEWFEALCRDWHPENVPPAVGAFTELAERGKPSTSGETAVYIDGVLTKYKRDWLAMNCFGRAMLSCFAYRTLGWTNTHSSGRHVGEFEPEEVYVRAMRAAWFSRTVEENISVAQNQAFAADAYDTIMAADLKPDCVVYADPACPFDAPGPNPYGFFINDLSKVLVQEDVPDLPVWTRHDKDLIYDEIELWMRAAFSRGAKYFVLGAETTNFPPPEEQYAYLANIFTLVGIWEGKTHSKQSHNDFSRFYAVYGR